jgi:hypothetical protein
VRQKVRKDTPVQCLGKAEFLQGDMVPVYDDGAQHTASYAAFLEELQKRRHHRIADGLHQIVTHGCGKGCVTMREFEAVWGVPFALQLRGFSEADAVTAHIKITAESPRRIALGQNPGFFIMSYEFFFVIPGRRLGLARFTFKARAAVLIITTALPPRATPQTGPGGGSLGCRTLCCAPGDLGGVVRIPY